MGGEANGDHRADDPRGDRGALRDLRLSDRRGPGATGRVHAPPSRARTPRRHRRRLARVARGDAGVGRGARALHAAHGNAPRGPGDGMTTTWAPSGDVAGLTDRVRLPRLGKIHLGVKKTSQRGTEYPSATDYFVTPQVVQDIYGEKPRELDVVFPTDEIGRVAGVSWKNYSSARGKVCWGDGEHAVRLVDEAKLAGIAAPSQDELDRAIASK